MSESDCGVRVDGHLGDLSAGQFVGALHLKCGGPGFDLEAARQCRGNQCRGDFLMDLDDTLPEQVFDQMEDGAGMTLQEAADRGNP